MKRALYLPLFLLGIVWQTGVLARLNTPDLLSNVSENILTLQFYEMTPHLGQKFEIRLIDMYTRIEVGRQKLDTIPDAEFQVFFDGIKDGRTYHVEFYSDHNENGRYDPPSNDHAWRLPVQNVQGDTIVTFTHNTNFTDIDWNYQLSLQFSDMTPHVGQQLGVRVLDREIRQEIGRRVMMIESADFELSLPGLMVGDDYLIDFYADLNSNMLYDLPPTDHAWRLQLEDVNGDTTIQFSHNTNFTDIAWNYLAVLLLSGMDPHLGQKFEARLIERSGRGELARETIDEIISPEFSLQMPGLISRQEYHLDFYADRNGNGKYDVPPVDHAWREVFTVISGDQTVEFSHNTDFVDINFPTSIIRRDRKIFPGNFILHENFPNPFNPETTIMFNLIQGGNTRLTIYNTMGQRVKDLLNKELLPGQYMIRWKGIDEYGNSVPSGIYYYRLENQTGGRVKRMLLLK